MTMEMDSHMMSMPVLALRGLVVFPEMLVNFDVEREKSVAALELAMEGNHQIFLTAQREVSVQEPGERDLFSVGTVAHVRQVLRISERTVRVMVTGVKRARLCGLFGTEPCLQGFVEPVYEVEARDGEETEAILRQTISIFSEYAELAPKLTDEVMGRVVDCRAPGYLADYLAQHLNLRHTDKQAVLEERHQLQRLKQVNELLLRETQVMSLEKELEEQVRQQFSERQKDEILRAQLRLIQSELGEDDDGNAELREYAEKIKKLGLPEETERQLFKEVDRLAKQPFGSAEAAVIRNYLDVCLEMPWNEATEERADVKAARKILDEDHYGLEKVKERILEFVAVRQMNPELRGQILCLVGPPGVGKTSIATSVARAMNRKLGRLSLGGVHDEADIRGHRKTYIGAMPGRIVDAIRRSGSMNPLLVMDEIDKLGQDMRGDPASALLEVFDREQNSAFRDHFLEIPLDLSRVMFITTANTLDTIPRPLLDRMEVIELSSYTDEEKLQIAKRHLLPKQMKEHGLTRAQLRVSDGAIRGVIERYTKESGVRVLERQLARVCRKAAVRLVEDGRKRVSVAEKDLEGLLGAPRCRAEKLSPVGQVGLVNGLAWTEAGGEVLQVEACVMDGTGKLELTGNLGDVMKESCSAAMTVIRSRADRFGLAPDFYKKKDVHIHFPEGAVPKDGPSAGIAITTALLSAFTGRPVRGDVAMTGEVTLRGRVLAIGGLKEKTMAAKRGGVREVLVPKENEKDLAEIDPTVREALTFHLVESVDEVLRRAICWEDGIEGQKPAARREEKKTRSSAAGLMQ
ncbi:MAG: endopeptidase La [Oscillospiraceae bacterium]